MPAPPFWVDVASPLQVPTGYEAPEMRFRNSVTSSLAQGGDPIPHPLTRWPGEMAQPPWLFNPKLRTNNFLKSYGFPSENVRAHFERADTRAFLAHVQQRAIRIPTQFNRFADQRGIPAVYVPTMPANNYSGPTQ